MTDTRPTRRGTSARHWKQPKRRRLVIAGSVLALLVISAALLPGLLRESPDPTPEDLRALVEVFGGEIAFAPLEDSGAERMSRYLTMRDGVRVAVDLWLPENLPSGRRLPAVIQPTRYWRNFDLRWPFNALIGPPLATRMLCRFGYALIIVDARGSGASFGVWPYPWSKEEIEDYREVLDWVVAQPWSNGRVAASGISYSGTAAEFMASLGHPALKAVLPRFSLYDAYAEIAFPGGVYNEWFVKHWSLFNSQLDAGVVPDDIGLPGRLLVRSVSPVPAGQWTRPGESSGQSALKQAFAEHRTNGDIHQAARGAVFRDDVAPQLGITIAEFSPHTRQAMTEAAGAAFYSWGGWFDGAYADALLKRFVTLRNPQRAVIGPWNHGAEQHASPYQDQDTPVTPPHKVQCLEEIRFLDHYLKDRGPAPQPGVIYYTLGEERWKHSPVWPPAGQRTVTLYIGPDHSLAHDPAEAVSGDAEQTAPAFDILDVDYAIGSGVLNRWRTQLLRSDVRIPDRSSSHARQDNGRGMLVYTSAPLDADMEVTGHPVVQLVIASTETDGAFVLALEDVDEHGVARCVTEGVFRALHRKQADTADAGVGFAPHHSFLRQDALPLVPDEPASLRFSLLPVSVRFKAGHRIRLVIAGHDSDAFARIPSTGTPRVRVYRTPSLCSQLELPVIPDRKHP